MLGRIQDWRHHIHRKVKLFGGRIRSSGTNEIELKTAEGEIITAYFKERVGERRKVKYIK